MLFTTIEEIQRHIAVGNATDIKRLTPHIENVETAYLRPLLGGDMMDELQEYYDVRPESVLTEVQEAMETLIGKVQKSLIHLAYWMGYQVLNSVVSDMGFKRSESTGTKSLFSSNEEELKEYFRVAGFNAMDEVLEFMEKNIVHFNEYKLAPNYVVLKEAFIPTTKIFDSIIFINNSRLTFLRLRSYSGLVEDMDVQPVLGAAIFKEIKTEMVKDAPAQKVKDILVYIRKAVAYLAASNLMAESGADLTEKGLYFESTTGTTINGRNKQVTDLLKVAEQSKRYRAIGESYLDQLKSYLAAHVEDWPGYSGQTGSVLRRDNAGKKTFWACG